MTYGFLPGAVPKGCEVEARTNSIIIGDTIVSTLYATGGAVDWSHPDTTIAFANNLQNVMKDTGLLDHCAEIWKD